MSHKDIDPQHEELTDDAREDLTVTAGRAVGAMPAALNKLNSLIHNDATPTATRLQAIELLFAVAGIGVHETADERQQYAAMADRLDRVESLINDIETWG